MERRYSLDKQCLEKNLVPNYDSKNTTDRYN